MYKLDFKKMERGWLVVNCELVELLSAEELRLYAYMLLKSRDKRFGVLDTDYLARKLDVTTGQISKALKCLRARNSIELLDEFSDDIEEVPSSVISNSHGRPIIRFKQTELYTVWQDENGGVPWE